MNNIKHLLGENIKRIRRRQHITQENLAELVDRSKNHISKIEQGLTNPPLDLLIEIANALNVSMNELFDFSYFDNTITTERMKTTLCTIQNKKNLELIYKIYSLIDNYENS